MLELSDNDILKFIVILYYTFAFFNYIKNDKLTKL